MKVFKKEKKKGGIKRRYGREFFNNLVFKREGIKV